MESRDLIKDNLEKSMNRVLSVFEELDDAALTFPTTNGGCHPSWLLGHFAYTDGMIIRSMMLGEANPLEEWKSMFDGGTEAVSEPSTYPPFAELVAKCREMRGETLALLDSLTEADLDMESKNVPPGLEKTFGSYRLCFQLVADHWYMHRGQVADTRRVMGLDRAGA